MTNRLIATVHSSQFGARSWLMPTIVFASLTALVLLPFGLNGRPFELRLFTIIFLNAAMGQAWNILGGYAGQTSIGHAIFFGLGAYTSTLAGLELGLNPWLGAVLAMLVSALAGVLLGFPCFRLKGHYFVIATLVIAESIFLVFTEWNAVGAAIGLEIPIRPSSWLNFQFGRDKTPYYWIALAFATLVTVFVARLSSHRLGFILKAIRDDESAARSLGYSLQRYKTIAIAFSAGLIGFAGTFYAQYVLLIDPPTVLGAPISIAIALIPLLGGIGTVSGPLLGAVVLTTLSEYSRAYFSGSGRNVDLMIYGALIMAIAAYRPAGLVSLFRRVRGLNAPESVPVDATAPAVPVTPTAAPAFERTAADPILCVRSVSRRFGGLQALDQVSFQVMRHEILGIVGPNGAGKSTLFGVMCGDIRPDSGSVKLEGMPLLGERSDTLARRGIVRTFQTPRPFLSMSFEENILVAALVRITDRREARREARARLAQVGLLDCADRPALGASTGQRKRLDIARALATNPTILLLDEPLGGVDPGSIPGVIELLQAIRAQGTTIVVIEHNLEALSGLADRLIAMALGTKIAEGAPADVMQDRRLVHAYLGAEVHAAA